MKKFAITAAFVAASVLSQATTSYSFVGDWTFTTDATLNYNTTLGAGNYNSNGSSIVSVSQVASDAFSFPVDFGGVTGSGDFDVLGDTVTDVNHSKTTDPFDVPFGTGTVSVRVTYPNWNLTGTVDDFDPVNFDQFGQLAYHITGDSVTVNNVQLEAFLFGSWQDLGSNNSFTINSWSLERDAVPEPATLTILGLGAVAAFKKRKRN
jgi:hypothetical protein